ncbi:MAG: hypothetical protein CL928_02815 [Deltaproteobacteria bacterium]|nr:hypothetical protein [Deltaproteobacteria bacterium]
MRERPPVGQGRQEVILEAGPGHGIAGDGAHMSGVTSRGWSHCRLGERLDSCRAVVNGDVLEGGGRVVGVCGRGCELDSLEDNTLRYDGVNQRWLWHCAAFGLAGCVEHENAQHRRHPTQGSQAGPMALESGWGREHELTLWEEAVIQGVASVSLR